MRVPYNTGRVKIGLLYEPPQLNLMTPEAEQLQSALLKIAPRHVETRKRELRLAMRDALMLLVGFGIFAAMIYAPSLLNLFN